MPLNPVRQTTTHQNYVKPAILSERHTVNYYHKEAPIAKSRPITKLPKRTVHKASMASQKQQHASGAVAGKLWGGRFSGATDPLMVAYNESIYFDRAFYAQDIAGSIAFARANIATGILTKDEFASIENGLKQVLEEWRTNTFKIVPGVDEDIHTANERRLGEIIGKEIAGKLHTGRSRNDQVATDLRLWLRDELRVVETYLVELLKVIAERAESDIEYVMPGYTHLQRGQPVRWSHWMLSYGTSFLNDLERLREVIKRVNRSPLGCGALSGNAFNIDREAMAQELGFDGLIHNSMSAVGDRDFILETMQWGSTLMLHISRWSEDLIIYSTTEFGFVRLSDAYTTGSSLMPQKKNSDSLELLRGKCGRIFGGMAGLMMTIKGIPSTYNKDLQESVEPLLEHIKTLKDSLLIATRVLSTLTVFPNKMLEALTPDMLATDLAEYLVRKGVPFRETHHIAGRVVALAEKGGIPMDKLTIAQLQAVDNRFGNDVLEVLNYERSVEMKSAIGGTSKSAVLEQIVTLRKALGGAE
ncbi:argininosuccinate lyase [Paracoccidioides brasiliensis]|uniref:argininosuccinate lyase n=1 Tax=Paracoccidioides brasiliensis TaxID=121759 RepID=A0A1D2JBU7_PARBR|nr:argininosuccinate lyase [Paracoccidioides brasiliensis]